MNHFFKGSNRFMLTYLFIVLNTAVYAYTAILSQNVMVIDDSVLERYGQYNFVIRESGWYWQLFTAMFVHINIVHIAGNMIFLLIFGLRAEEMFKSHEYLLIYLLSGLTGNILTLLIGPYVLSAGASGAIFGLFGAVTIYARRILGQPVLGALMFAFMLLVLSAGIEVNILAHLGGLIVGLLFGYILAVTRKFKAVYQYRHSA
jgi:rhomboid protease GluP